MRSVLQTATVCFTELRAEWRSRRVLTTMLLLAGLSVVTFGFAGRAGSAHLASPALWVSLLLATTAGIAQTIGRHEAAAVDDALLMSALSRSALYLGRLLAFFLLLLATAALCWALTAVLFGSLTTGVGQLGVLLVLGSLGLSALGVAIALSVSHSNVGAGRVVPLLLLPLALPLMLIGARGTQSIGAAETAGGYAAVTVWTSILGASDVVLITLGLLIASRLTSRS